MTAGVESLRHRHVLTAPTVPETVRPVRETAETACAEWGIAAAHPTMGPAPGTCVVRRDADGGGGSVWITLPL
ncbi:hypothetical protein [Streptomyces sp. NPDC004788]